MSFESSNNGEKTDRQTVMPLQSAGYKMRVYVSQHKLPSDVATVPTTIEVMILESGTFETDPIKRMKKVATALRRLLGEELQFNKLNGECTADQIRDARAILEDLRQDSRAEDVAREYLSKLSDL